MTPHPVDRYVRHARRFGTELVFETAASELSAMQLGSLSLQLQKLDAKWRLAADRAVFARELVATGIPTARACEMAMISRWTLRRRDQLSPEEAQPAEYRPDPLISRGANGANRRTPTEPLEVP